MKKVYSLLSLFLILFGITASAQVTTLEDLVGKSIDDAPKVFVRNARSERFANGVEGAQTTQTAVLANSTLWQFIDASAAVSNLNEGVKAVYIYNVGIGKYLQWVGTGGYQATAAAATVWYVQPNENDGFAGFNISNKQDVSDNGSSWTIGRMGGN